MAPEGWESRWVCGKETYEKLLEDNFIEWKKVTKNGEEKWQVYQKHYINKDGKESSDLWAKEAGNKKGTRELNALFDGKKIFDNPKPVDVLKKIVKLGAHDSSTILDFFAGSGGIAQAVMELNIEENLNLKSFLVQLPERLNDTEKKVKQNRVAIDFLTMNGFPLNIAEIGKERIRRAAAKIKDENPEYDGDLGFKVFKLDSSNIRAWNPDRSDLEQTLIDHMEHLVEGRSEEDVLYELLLKRGIDLTVPIEEKTITGKTVYSIGYGVLFACLDTTISREEVEDLAMGIIDWHKELEPAGDTQVVFRDSAFANDIAKTNMAAILEQHGIAHVRSL